VVREPLQHAAGRDAVAITDSVERFPDGRFNRAAADVVDAMSACAQPENRPAAIPGVVHPQQQPLRDEPPQDAGEGTGMDVKHRGQVARRQPGKQAHDPKDEALGPGYAELGGHPLGRPPHRMDHCPQELHELQHVWKLVGDGIAVVRNRAFHLIILNAD